MIDLHCHVLWGIDDGPETIEGSLELARGAAAAGIRTVVATPHVSPRYPNRAERIAQLVVELNERLAREGIALEVLSGAEIALTRLPDVEPHELSMMRLGEGPWLLIECPFSAMVGGLDVLLLELQRRDQKIILAHPERCSTFQRDPQMLARLVESGVLTSITAGSLVGDFGDGVRRFALELIGGELVHNVASDAHDAFNRPPSVIDKLDQAGLSPLTEWLTSEVPGAVLSGAEIPPRPSVMLVEAAPPPSRPKRRAFRWSG